MATKKRAAVKPKPGQSKAAAQHRRKVFIEAYLNNNGNATQAAISAGFSEKTAYSQGSRMLKNVEVQAAILERHQKVSESLELTTERTLREVARLAYFDPRKLFDSTGRPKPLSDLDDDTAAAIAGLEVVDKYEDAKDGNGKNLSTVLKYRIADKKGALDLAMRHQGLFERDNKQRSLLEGVDRETLKLIAEHLRGNPA